MAPTRFHPCTPASPHSAAAAQRRCVLQADLRALAIPSDATLPFDPLLTAGAHRQPGRLMLIADHIHMHLVPRWVGDTNFMPALGDVRVMPQHLDETYALLRGGFAA